MAEFSDQGGTDWGQRLKRSFDRATPTVSGPGDREAAYLLVPDTAGGERVAGRVKDRVAGRGGHPGLAGQRGDVLPGDEAPAGRTSGTTLHYCREAYEERSARPAPSPHARFDVVEWLPLDV